MSTETFVDLNNFYLLFINLKNQKTEPAIIMMMIHIKDKYDKSLNND